MSPVYGANQEVATVIAQICTVKNKLPQGAPTSPVLSNMICGKLDSELKLIATEHRCRYSRYCDDLSFSTNHSQFPKYLASVVGSGDERSIELGASIVDAIEKNGFKINTKKTRLLSRSDRLEVTGLTVNRFVNVSRKYVRSLRGCLHAWRKHGHEAASDKFSTSYDFRTRKEVNFERVIFGRIQYVGSIRGYDDDVYRKLRDQFNELSSLKIPIHESSWDYKLENAIWVLESESGTMQATAFFLDGVGLVTCAHCVEPESFVYHPSNPTKKIKVAVDVSSDAIDLAILKVEDSTFGAPASFKLAGDSSSVQRGDPTVLAGFPEFAPGSELSVKPGQVNSIKMKSGVRRFNISSPIIAGNSGGPVFNSRNQVVGVAVTGSDSEEDAGSTESHGVIPISALEHLLPKLNTPL